MRENLEELLDGFHSTNSSAVKSAIYNEMLMKVNSHCKNARYGCYDMFMYVALYKCAVLPQQRKHALEQMYSIIIDDTYQNHSELIQNLEEFTQMKEFLNEDDVIEFDAICMEALDFFEKKMKESEFEAFAGQSDFIPEVPLWEAENELKKVAELVVSTGMSDLESYQEAVKVLNTWEEWVVKYISRLFCKCSYNVDFLKDIAPK